MSTNTSDEPNRVNGTGQKPIDGQEQSERVEQQLDEHDASGQDGDSPASHSTTTPPPSKPGILARLGLDAPTVIMMIKGSIPPTVAIAMFQATPVADYFSTLGFLVGIMSILNTCILPRGKFIQTLLLNVLFACAGAAVSLLIMWSALQARLHTQSEPVDPATGQAYNSSQSAVSAIWLFAGIWFVNVLRARQPSLNVPVIVASIFVSIGSTYSPLMTTNAAFISIVQRILTAMLTGFAISAACSLLVFPVPSRTVTNAQMKGLIMLLRGAVKQEKLYMQALEREDMFAKPHDISAEVHTKKTKSEKAKEETSSEAVSMAEARALKQTITGIRQLTGKLQADIEFAKRDFCWGKLEPDDLQEIFNHLRSCLIPVNGMSTLIDIFQRVAENRNWATNDETPPEVLAEKNEEKRVWNKVMKQLHEPFESLSEAIDQGLEHAGILLEILPKPAAEKKKQAGQSNKTIDVEAAGGLIRPGDPEFGRGFREKVQAIQDVKTSILRVWAIERGLITDEASLETVNKEAFASDDATHLRDQSQLYLLLYIEKLMQESGEAVAKFVAFADKKVESGAMKKNRLILPSFKRLRKWAASLFQEEDTSAEDNANLFDSGINVVYIGDGFAAKKDPEHLPAANTIERVGNVIRTISKFISSDKSAFGFRVACATMTVAIVCFLEPTQAFFQKQRLVWAMIIISISMTETSGQSIFGFLCRVGGTLAAMVVSIIAWYIVDGQIPGVLVFMAVFLVLGHYLFLKFPQLIPASMMLIVTMVLILGYELQVAKLGVALSESTGQPYYPVYLLAPYRLATVAGGCLVAFIWTVFPSPITDRTWLRRDLSATMYLLAHYLTVIDATLRSRLDDTGGDPELKTSPAYRLTKHRHRLFGKLLLILPSLNQHANFQRFEPTIGGRFPREIYLDIIQRSTRIASYLTLMSHTVTWSANPSAEDRAWISALSDLLRHVSSTKDGIVCTLTLLSHSLQSGHPLPPNVPFPKPYALARQLESLTTMKEDGGEGKIRHLLDARNMSESGYTEFAVMQVCSTLVCNDLEGLVKSVGQLVGVVDFSFRIESNSSILNTGSSTFDSPPTETEGKGKGKID